LTFFGITYWMVPKMVGKPLFSRKMGLWQAWTWFVGMLLMSNGLHILGINFTVPRRTMLGVSPYASADWQPLLIEAVIGGVILGVSGLLYYINIVGTVAHKKQLEEEIEMPVAEAMDEGSTPVWLDTWKPWVITALALVLISYGPVLVYMISNLNMSSPGFRVW
jgi:cytochrome c oxidase subunit 1